MVVRVTMDLVQHRYYRLGKILMSLIGQWPYQSYRTRRGIPAVLILFTTFHIVPEILAVVKYWDDWNILVECLLPHIFNAVCVTKYIGFIWNSHKTLQLLNRIHTDWQVWARDREVKFLHEYAERGEKITIVYTEIAILRTAALYSAMVVFMMQPSITKLINVILRNSTEPGKFPFPVVYYRLDAQKYYYYLIIYCTICGCIHLTSLISSDVMLTIYVQHVCGLFAAVGHKIERVRYNNTSVKKAPHTLDKTDMLYIALCIDRHNDAIRYADLIESSHKWNFFFTLGFGMIFINASGLQILLKTNDHGATLTAIVLILGISFYFYMECYISQVLMDHSISVRVYILNSQWYTVSPNAQKLLQFMTMRCNVPCQLTAGKVLTMSVQTFGLVLKTFISLFACVRSMQGL